MKSMAYTVLPSYAYDNVRTYVQWFVESLCSKEYYYLKGINFLRELIFENDFISNIFARTYFRESFFFFNYFFR